MTPQTISNKRSLQMYSLRTELIKATLSSLKIDDNPFNQQIVSDKIQHIPDNQLQNFYGRLFDASHQYLNGLDRVAKVAEQFKKHIVEVDETREKAKELINLVHAMNDSVYQEHIKSGKRFDDLLNAVNFPSLNKTDEAILSNVAPHYDLKTLIANINHYQTSEEAIKAFIQALKYAPSDAIQIANPTKKLQIKRG